MTQVKINQLFTKIRNTLLADFLEIALRQYGLELERLIIAELDRQKRNVDGGLRKSVTHQIKHEVKRWVMMVGPGVHYAPYVELGTRPHLPPFTPIYRWVKKRGITGKATQSKTNRQKAIARAIQWAIARKGTKAHPFLSLVFHREKDKVAAKISQSIMREIDKTSTIKVRI